MVSYAASCVSRDFAIDARRLGHYISRLERAASSGAVSGGDLGRVYAGAMLALCNAIESVLERLFVGVVTSRLKVSGPAANPRLKVGSPLIVRELVCGDRSYVDWLPYSRTKDRARIYLNGGHPFTRLSPQDESAFERVEVIRNAVAHPSGVAMSVFERTLVGSLPLPPAQITPVGYLRGQHSGAQTRFTALLAQCAISVFALCL